jgi:hypothetical protein
MILEGKDHVELWMVHTQVGMLQKLRQMVVVVTEPDTRFMGDGTDFLV